MFTENVIPISLLTIDTVRKFRDARTAFYIYNGGGELFQHPETDEAPENCLCVDIQSANVMVLIYDALNDKNKAKFNTVLQNEYKLANFIDCMWDMVKSH